MPSFVYKALQDGRMTEGALEASGRQDALRKLEGQGCRPISLNESKNGAGGAKAGTKSTKAGAGSQSVGSLFGGKVSAKERENFTRQLASLLAAGVPLSKALQILGREAARPLLKEKWQAIHNKVIDGTALNEAMAHDSKTFPRVYTAMVQAGETGGFLDLVLTQIADFQETERELKSRVQSAMIYPAVLMLLLVLVLTYLMVFFIPKFKTLFAGFDAELPLPTQIVMGMSNFARDYGLVILIVVGVIAYSFSKWLASEEGRRHWQGLLLRMPLIGPLNARFAMTRFCRMLGTLVGAGVPLIQGLKVARESIGNQTLIDSIGSSIERVRQGDPLAASLRDCDVMFSGSTIEMISIAEESGNLDSELVRLANVAGKELDGQLRNAVALMEPLMLFIMAGVIGSIFLSMVLPIFTIQDYIK